MVCLPLQQFVALMEAWAWGTPPVGLSLILPLCVNPDRGFASSGESAGSQNFRIVWVQFAFADLLERVDFSLAKFLGADGRWKSLHCRNKLGKRQFCGFLAEWRGKWGWQGTGMIITPGSLSQCVRKMTHPAPPADSFLATGLGMTLKWTVEVPHLTVWHTIFPWHLITLPFSTAFCSEPNVTS